MFGFWEGGGVFADVVVFVGWVCYCCCFDVGCFDLGGLMSLVCL